MPLIIDPSTPNIERLQRNFVECDVGMFSKIPPIHSYIQPRKHMALQVKRHKLLIDRNQTSISGGQYVCSIECEVSGKSLI